MKKKKVPILLAFGQKVRVIREKAGLTQREVAKRSGLDVTYISGLERSVRNPSLMSLEKLAKGLGCSMADTCQDLDKLDLGKRPPKKTKKKG